MHRLFAILLALGLVSATVGCRHTHGVCDCDLGPIGHDGPPPLAMPPTLHPIPAQPMPQAPAKYSATSKIEPIEPIEPIERVTSSDQTEPSENSIPSPAAEPIK